MSDNDDSDDEQNSKHPVPRRDNDDEEEKGGKHPMPRRDDEG